MVVRHSLRRSLSSYAKIVGGQAGRIRSEVACRAYTTTSSNNPADFTLADAGKLYQVPNETCDILKFDEKLPLRSKKQLSTLGECVWLCRTPLLEAINVLRAVDVGRPAPRAVLWGQFGTGKSVTLHQTVHYAHTQDYVIVADYEVMRWSRLLREIQASTHTPGLIDTLYHSSNVLTLFKHINQLKWKELSELKTERKYTWSKVEYTDEGKPITEIVEIGLAMPYLATDCVGALCRELRRYASAGAIRLLVALDQANSLYGTRTVYRKHGTQPISAGKVFANVSEIALVQIFRRFLRNDWTNGACVLVADKTEIVSAYDRVTIPRNTPMELFGEEGVDAIDPFIPIETKRYTMEEIDVLYDYYIEKEWLTSEGARTEHGRKQLAYLSAFNPNYFDRLCALH